jgi:hypothetical protein
MSAHPLLKDREQPDRWMQQLSWSLSRWETQDIKTQPKFNQYVDKTINGLTDHWVETAAGRY